MPELNVTFAGLTLPSPFVAGLTPITATTDIASALINAGAGALLLPPLSEEQLQTAESSDEVLPNQATHTGVQRMQDLRAHLNTRAYLDVLEHAKDMSSVPVIGSVEMLHRRPLLRTSKRMKQSGADALEIRILGQADSLERSDVSEKRALRMIAMVKDLVDLPIVARIQRPVTGCAAFAQAAHKAGADAILFGSLGPTFKTDKDNFVLSDEEPTASEQFFAALLTSDVARSTYRRTPANLAVAVETLNLDVAVNAIGAGSTVIVLQAATAGAGQAERSIASSVSDLKHWLRDRGYDSLYDFRGALSQSRLTSTLESRRS